MKLVWDFLIHYLFSKQAGSVVKRISWLSIVGLSISLGSLIIVISVMNALNQNMKKRTLAFEPHLVVQFPELKSSEEVFTHPLTQKLKLNSDFEVSLYESTDVILRTLDGHFRGAVAEGVSQEVYNAISARLKILAKEHSPITTGFDSMPDTGEVDLGSDLARSLGVFEGDLLLVITPESMLMSQSESPKYEQVRVRRIISTTVADIDGKLMFYQIGKSLKSLTRSLSQSLGLQVRVKDPFTVDKLKNELQLFSEIKVETWIERNSALFLALKLEKSVIAVFLSLASLLAGFSLISALTLLISQKQKDIGILSAMGLSAKSIKQLFSKLGLILLSFGLLGGLLLGLGVSFYLQLYPLNILPDVYQDSQVPAQVDPGFISFVIVVVVVLGWWGAKTISSQATEINPSEALRSKIGVN